MTTKECYALRKKDGFVTPFPPLERGVKYCVFQTRGNCEWLVHPDDAKLLYVSGMKIDGVLCKVTRVDDWPYVNAVMVRASLPAATTYIDPTKT